MINTQNEKPLRALNSPVMVSPTAQPSFTLGHADALKCLKQQLLIASTTFQALREKESALQELVETFQNQEKRFAAQEQQLQNLYAQINAKNQALEALRIRDVAMQAELFKLKKKAGKKVGKRK